MMLCILAEFWMLLTKSRNRREIFCVVCREVSQRDWFRSRRATVTSDARPSVEIDTRSVGELLLLSTSYAKIFMEIGFPIMTGGSFNFAVNSN